MILMWGEWITRVSGGEGALDTPGPLMARAKRAGDPGSIPGRGNLNVCLQLGSRDIINNMHLVLHPPSPHHRCIMLNHTTY